MVRWLVPNPSDLEENPRRRRRKGRSSSRRRRSSSRRRRTRKNPTNPFRSSRRRRRKSRRSSRRATRRNPFRIGGGGFLGSLVPAISKGATFFGAIWAIDFVQQAVTSKALPASMKPLSAPMRAAMSLGLGVAVGWALRRFGGPLKFLASSAAMAGAYRAIWHVVPAGYFGSAVASSVGLSGDGLGAFITEGEQVAGLGSFDDGLLGAYMNDGTPALTPYGY